jgi:hypothetical protein
MRLQCVICGARANDCICAVRLADRTNRNKITWGDGAFLTLPPDNLGPVGSSRIVDSNNSLPPKPFIPYRPMVIGKHCPMCCQPADAADLLERVRKQIRNWPQDNGLKASLLMILGDGGKPEPDYKRALLDLLMALCYCGPGSNTLDGVMGAAIERAGLPLPRHGGPVALRLALEAMGIARPEDDEDEP